MRQPPAAITMSSALIHERTERTAEKSWHSSAYLMKVERAQRLAQACPCGRPNRPATSLPSGLSGPYLSNHSGSQHG